VKSFLKEKQYFPTITIMKHSRVQYYGDFFFFLNLVKIVGVEQRKNAPLEEISTLLHCSSKRHLTGHAGGKIEKKHSPPSLATTE
jgi:hypothetical protein